MSLTCESSGGVLRHVFQGFLTHCGFTLQHNRLRYEVTDAIYFFRSTRIAGTCGTDQSCLTCTACGFVFENLVVSRT